MIRYLAIAVLVLVVILVVRLAILSFLSGLRGTGAPARRQALRDDLVKDPVCETYIPRRKAIPRQDGSGTRYFCSAACADRYARRA